MMTAQAFLGAFKQKRKRIMRPDERKLDAVMEDVHLKEDYNDRNFLLSSIKYKFNIKKKELGKFLIII